MFVSAGAQFVLALAQAVHPVAEIDSAVREGIEAGAFPGAVVMIGTADTVLLARGYGTLTWDGSWGSPSADSTLYDLASLTKVVGTTAAAMRLVDRGVLDLETRVQEILPRFAGEGKGDITVEHLLSHSSGLRAFLDLRDEPSGDAARDRVLRELPRTPPGRSVVYSDLNAMLLGWVVESVAGRTLDRVIRDEVTQPLGMSLTCFRPPPGLRSHTAPINVWRGHVIAGVVHDQNAERLGGIAGHAGLYGTGSDLARYAQMYLRGGRTADGGVFVSDSVLSRFVERRDGNRALGWEVRDTTTVGSAGSRMSATAIGHGGFTGTSMWIDAEAGLFAIVLTNRVYAPRTGRSISILRGVRGRIADSAVALKERFCRLGNLAGREWQGCG